MKRECWVYPGRTDAWWINLTLVKFSSTIEEIISATRKFELKFDIPQVIGCVDGTHIPIVQPQENSHDYFCYKMKFSLNCQAIYNENGHFADVELRWPGSVHDVRVYSNSFVNKRLRIPGSLYHEEHQYHNSL